MIPERIQLEGFLSYRHKQEIDFSGATVWMLWGANGSGKSAIFDALTYALYGSHRGGNQHAVELINKDSQELAVVFDFRIESELYRIRRTLRRGQRNSANGTQQIFHHSGLPSPRDWEAVPDTHRKTTFDEWIQTHIGLNYDTFTSSILLLQGKAEKLLDAKQSERAKVLAGIVDIERYQKLHESANSEKLHRKGRIDSLNHQFAGIPDISEDDFLAAITTIENCLDAREKAVTEIDRLSDLEGNARLWFDAETRLAAARQKLGDAQALLGNAAAIETAYTRYSELRVVLPAAHVVVTTRGQVNDSVRKVEKLQRERTEAEERRIAADKSLDEAIRQRTLVQKQRDADEAENKTINERLRLLSASLQTAGLVEQQKAELRRLEDEIGRIAADPESLVRQAKEKRDHLDTLDRFLPNLERLTIERAEISEREQLRCEQTRLKDEVEEEGRKVGNAYNQIMKELQAAREKLSAAVQEHAVATTLLDQAKAAANEFAKLSDAKSCRACGQPLTQMHFAEEKKKRDAEVSAAEERLAATTKAKEDADQINSALAHSEKDQGTILQKKREDFRDHQHAVKQAVADIQRLSESLVVRYRELPQEIRKRIAAEVPADWSKTTYPDSVTLEELKREASELDASKRAVRDAETLMAHAHDLRSQRDAATRALAALESTLPNADVVALSREQTTLQAREKTLSTNLKAARQSLDKASSDIHRYQKESHEASQTLTDISGKLQTEGVNQNHCRDTISRALAGLTESWRPLVETAGIAQYSTWKDEHDELVAQETESRYQRLATARYALEALRDDISRCEADVGRYPPEARRRPEEIRTLLAAARETLDAKDSDLRDAHRNRDNLDNYRRQRDGLGAEMRRIEREFGYYRLLADLLHRDRLQLHLLRQAERQIVEYANTVLDRLSGGQLFLQLAGNDDNSSEERALSSATSEKALELECLNRLTGSTPIKVAYLSGSQRFRVAVSLALAIGQYASRQQRQVECVIIDEGFGCLDRQGRQVMIQELLNLRGHLQRILLVSHQEEFAEAFANGYRFELIHDTTHVAPLRN